MTVSGGYVETAARDIKFIRHLDKYLNGEDL